MISFGEPDSGRNGSNGCDDAKTLVDANVRIGLAEDRGTHVKKREVGEREVIVLQLIKVTWKDLR